MLGRERSYRTEDDGEQGCERLLCEEELFQLGEIGWRDVGNCAEGKPVLLPGEPMVALGFASAIPVAFRRALFHEDIDDVLAAGVDEGNAPLKCPSRVKLEHRNPESRGQGAFVLHHLKN